MIDTIISTQCVNFRQCGGNVMLLPSSSGLNTRAEIIGQTCACSYSDDDLAWFDREVLLERTHP